MRKLLKRKNGEGYVDVAVTILIVSFVLVFAVNIVSLVALNQNIKTASDRIAEYASQQGTTDIADYVDELSEKMGVDFYCSFDGSELYDSSGKVQLGDKIQCTLTYGVNILGFGEAVHGISISASSTGISRVYWK